MLIISAQQRATLALAVLKDLEDEVVQSECARSQPGGEAAGDEEALRACIRLAFAKADEAGFTGRDAAMAYTQAVLRCGLGFATDPMHRWAAPAIQSKGQAAERGQLLLHVMAKAAPAFSVVEWWRADSAAENLLGALECAAGELPDDLPLGVLRHLAIDIRRVTDLDEPGVRRLFAVAESMAQRCGMSGQLGTSVFLLTVVLFGHDCASDPRYAWVNRIELSSADQPVSRRLKIVLEACRRHIARHLVGAPARPQMSFLPMRLLPTGQRLLSISLGSALQPHDESQALDQQV